MSDLDDFFAKKDKKKGKKKFATADQLAKKLEENVKKTEKQSKKEKEKVIPLISPQLITEEHEDPNNPDAVKPVHTKEAEEEWREFEEEKEKDYSGLKIKHLQIEENQVSPTEEEEPVLNEEGEVIPRKENSSGPWNKINVAKSAPVIEEKPEVKPSLPSGCVSDGAYIPPHLRNRPAASSSSSRPGRSKAAPDITSEVYFPSLSAAAASEVSGAWGRKLIKQHEREYESGFEEVRNSKSHPMRSTEEGRISAPKVSIGNKFDALAESDQS